MDREERNAYRQAIQKEQVDALTAETARSLGITDPVRVETMRAMCHASFSSGVAVGAAEVQATFEAARAWAGGGPLAEEDD